MTKCLLSGQKATESTHELCPERVPARFACWLKERGKEGGGRGREGREGGGRGREGREGGGRGREREGGREGEGGREREGEGGREEGGRGREGRVGRREEGRSKNMYVYIMSMREVHTYNGSEPENA